MGLADGDLDDIGFGVAKAVLVPLVRACYGVRQQHARLGADLTELIEVAFPDKVKRRDLNRRLEVLAEKIDQRLRPLYKSEFGPVPENERAAALLAVVDVFQRADLGDSALFALDADATKLARSLKQKFADNHGVNC